ncbi:MAG: hypothetical protein ACSHXK_16630 [Oceanococcus sp.]
MNAAEEKPRRRKLGEEREPLQVNLSVAVRFGNDEDDRVVLVDEREIKMVGSIFRYRDRIAKFMVTGLLRAAMLQPKVAAKLFPKLSGLRPKG